MHENWWRQTLKRSWGISKRFVARIVCIYSTFIINCQVMNIYGICRSNVLPWFRQLLRLVEIGLNHDPHCQFGWYTTQIRYASREHWSLTDPRSPRGVIWSRVTFYELPTLDISLKSKKPLSLYLYSPVSQTSHRQLSCDIMTCPLAKNDIYISISRPAQFWTGCTLLSPPLCFFFFALRWFGIN